MAVYGCFDSRNRVVRVHVSFFVRPLFYISSRREECVLCVPRSRPRGPRYTYGFTGYSFIYRVGVQSSKEPAQNGR